MIHIFISTTVKTTLIRRHREEKQTRKKISSEDIQLGIKANRKLLEAWILETARE